MSGTEDSREWESATWQGARRAQIREYLKLTIRERLEAVAAMGEVAARLRVSTERAAKPNQLKTE